MHLHWSDRRSARCLVHHGMESGIGGCRRMAGGEVFLQGVGGKLLAHARTVQYAARAVVDERGSVDAPFLCVAQYGVDALSFELGNKLVLVIRLPARERTVRFLSRLPVSIPISDLERVKLFCTASGRGFSRKART